MNRRIFFATLLTSKLMPRAVRGRWIPALHRDTQQWEKRGMWIWEREYQELLRRVPQGVVFGYIKSSK